MKIHELEKLAREGKLFVRCSLYREYTRHKKYWDMTKDGEWRENPDREMVKYKVYSYLARTEDMPEGSFYRITKNDLKLLKEAGAKEMA